MENVILIIGSVTMVSLGVAFVSFRENPKACRFSIVMVCLSVFLLTVHSVFG